MPYYRWQGIDLSGRVRSGKLFASSANALDLFLLKRDMALISSEIASIRLLPKITQEATMQFFDRLALLLRSGVLVPEAIAVLRDSMGHVRMQILIDDIAQRVERGVPLHAALATHPDIFDDRMVQMVYIGQETGSLPLTVQAMASYLEMVITFKAKIKSAAMTPIISFLFFLVVMTVILVGIIPSLASVFDSVHQKLPAITQFLLYMSFFLRSWTGLLVVGAVLATSFVGMRWLFQQRVCKHVYDRIVIRMPFMRDIICNSQRAWFLDSLVLLVNGGMSLLPALAIAQRSCGNSKVYEYVSMIGNSVAVGNSLSVAFEQCPGDFFSQQDIAIIAVGENVGQLAHALTQVAQASRSRATASISLITHVLQPLLFIILGLMVTLLILAIYAPMFTLSWAIA